MASAGINNLLLLCLPMMEYYAVLINLLPLAPLKNGREIRARYHPR